MQESYHIPAISQEKFSLFAEKKVSQNRIFFLTVTGGGGAAPRNSLGFNELRLVKLNLLFQLFGKCILNVS
jgi:hypothetical protein